MLRSPKAVGAALLATALCAGPLSATMASAALTTCRTDPIVVLSNGKQLNIVATITDTVSDVQKIGYVVHVPAGLGVTKITYTGRAFAGKEVLIVYADDTANNYDTHTVLKTATAGKAITVTVKGLAGSTYLGSASASGVSGQDVLVHFSM